MQRYRRALLILISLAFASLLGFEIGSASAKKRRSQVKRASRASAALDAQQPKAAAKDEKAEGKERKPEGGYCISPAAPKAISECPDYQPKSRLRRSRAPRSRLRQAKRKAEPKKDTRPKGPSFEIDLATLTARDRIKSKAQSLLKKEIRITQRLIRNTRKNHPQRPDYLLRLGEGYFELMQQQTVALRNLDDPIFAACKEKKDAGRCRRLQGQQKTAFAALKKTREANIRTLATLVQDHPHFRRMDEVLFQLGFALEEMRQNDRALKVYRKLVKGYPQSRFIPHAYLSFAEHYFGNGEMRAALTFYRKVTDVPPGRNPVYGYAVYKQAWCHYNLEDYRRSLQSFVETVEFAQKHPEAKDVKNLAKQSRREMVMPYAQVGNPTRALEFFRRYADNDKHALELLESLAEIYYDTGNWRNTIAVYHALMAEQPRSGRVCFWQSRVTNAVVSSRAKNRQVTEIERLVDLYEAFVGGSYSDEDKRKCKQAAASVLIDLATAWHREAIGTDSQPGTNDRSTMELASRLYRLITKKFPEMEQMEFPEIDRRDWPTLYRVSYFQAELLWKMEDWGQCGPAFDKVVEINPQGEFTSDAAYAAVLCYNNLYQQTFKRRETQLRGSKGRGQKSAQIAKFRPRDFTKLESGMLSAFQRYVCFVPDSQDLPQIKYRRARIYYESNHFEEAALLFKDIAYNHKESDLAVYAANLYLDSLNVLASFTKPRRPSCYDEMNDSIEPLYGIYCAGEQAKEDHQDLCGVLEQLRCDLLRKKAEAYQENEEYKNAAKVYVGIFRKYAECGRLDEVLYNAALNFEAARLLGRSIKVRKVLAERFPKSKLARRAVFLIGANYHALAIYSTAADYYEQFAREYPKEDGRSCTAKEKRTGVCAIAHDALQNAVFFRLGLGDEEKAVEDASLFERHFKRKHPRQTSQVVYSLGSIYERDENWSKVVSHYQKYLRTYGRMAMPHEKIQANVEIGRAYWQLGDRKKSVRAYKVASDLWRKGAAKRIAKLPVEAAKKQRYSAVAKVAVGEALFRQSDQLFERFRAIEFPIFKGKATGKIKKSKKKKKKKSRRWSRKLQKAQKKRMETFQKWLQNDFVKWMKSKEKALTAARVSYEQIAKLKVPQWDIAAAARIGDMYREIVDQFREAPVPPVFEKDEELVDIYYQSLDEQSQPWVMRAKDAYEFCLITATKVRWFNEFMTQCETELFRLDPRKYPRAAELRGRGRYIHTAEARPDVVDLGLGDEEEQSDG
ncbi:MAG: tetratricopeptide repeat protein [Proteobacteria bacterium]|nr:tetratricopeptide repeat protein [Pseudomonadota bacterium]